ncbi:hypothetical protein KBI23_05955 [bacterium]|jgi:hypothetical protein|nr:hypothetical protein [bacterium]MBP9810486.1 hypothetical protein [bacterium]
MTALRMTPMQAYKLAITQLLEALTQCRGNAADQEELDEQTEVELEFSPTATALLDELDMAVDDIDMLSGTMHPRVAEIIAELETLNEPGIEEILASVRANLPKISALATATVTYLQAYNLLEDNELQTAEQLLDDTLEEAGEDVADDFRELESELHRQLINYSFAPIGESHTIH